MSESKKKVLENENADRSLSIICVTNRKLCRIPFLKQLEKIAGAGVEKIILREKDLSEGEYAQLAEKFLTICRAHNIEGVFHTYGEAALLAGAHSLHLSMKGLRSWKEIHPQPLFQRLGASVHSVAEAREAQQLGADYITAGHVFTTECKKGLPGRGIEFLREVVIAVDIPVYAIGGIDVSNLCHIRDCGIAGICIMSSLMEARIPALLTESLQKAWDKP